METEKAIYFSLLSKGGISQTTINKILDLMIEQDLKINPINPGIYKEYEFGGEITKQLTRLNLSIVEGNPSWEGLLVGFPGTVGQLSTKSVGTPYLRMIMYPILDLHHRLQSKYNQRRAFPRSLLREQ
jgi:hypothetical protein